MTLAHDAYSQLPADKLPASHRHALARETLDHKDIRVLHRTEAGDRDCILGICGSDPTPGNERSGVYVVLALHRDEHDKPTVTSRGDADLPATAAERYRHLIADCGGESPGLSGADVEKLVRRALREQAKAA